MAKSNSKGLKAPQGLKAAAKPVDNAEQKVEVEVHTAEGNQTVEIDENAVVAEATDNVPEGEPTENEDGSVNVYDENGEKVGTMSAEDVEKVEEAVSAESVDTSPKVEVDVTPPSQQLQQMASDETAPKVNVTVSAESVGTFKMPKQNVKIRLRSNHSCTIGKESYDFKAGKVYTVPKNVKKVLNRAGLLSPL